MREEMKDEAAEEGAPVRTQTVGSRTDLASRKPVGRCAGTCGGVSQVGTHGKGFVGEEMEGQLTFSCMIICDHLDDVLTHSITCLRDQRRVPAQQPRAISLYSPSYNPLTSDR